MRIGDGLDLKAEADKPRAGILGDRPRRADPVDLDPLRTEHQVDRAADRIRIDDVARVLQGLEMARRHLVDDGA